MTKQKMPNKIVSQVEGNEEEDNACEFQDNVLSCLSDLQHLALIIKDKAEAIELKVRSFKTSIHGEDIDNY